MCGANCLKDLDIRKEIHSQRPLPFLSTPDITIIDELDVGYESARIDVAAIGDSLYGIEIKSDADSFYRLPAQITAYNKVFDYLYLAVGDKFFGKAEAFLPPWWGIVHITMGTDKLTTTIVRNAKKNINVQKRSLANMLWKKEMLLLLATKELGKGLSKRERAFILDKVAEELPLEEIQTWVRKSITARQPTRVDAQQTRYADLCRSGPRSRDFRERNLSLFLSRI
ncbi:MAG: sce7726 family protein [Spirochaetia bacterium]|nr:sce7726 family protein [Spirochaetia bacterium]MCE1208127.1 sce7726 family protein [Spirochaetia bacterium]